MTLEPLPLATLVSSFGLRECKAAEKSVLYEKACRHAACSYGSVSCIFVSENNV